MYEQLLIEFEAEAKILEVDMPTSIKGLYSDNVIWINKRVRTSIERACILAEELGHHYTSTGDILDQSDIWNRKQELRARNWAYEKLVPLSAIIQAHQLGIRNRFELAEHLGVTEDFLEAALKRFQEKYGLCVQVEKYTVCFDPLGVIEYFD
ncbi:membrane protein [Paenibacillus dendritiformis]|uniref:ImmA/IrrE family metallo-endopeptidase n=1 Tax=Paenibacillus TaxID=44249 RepID=UPI001B0DC75B|nr:ImmA/IrrE family metallo-endopeptidase [Paenibacillus dendritiformis]GIO82882.1 membrane protein [Paenibacillus dendritiformis]